MTLSLRPRWDGVDKVLVKDLVKDLVKVLVKDLVKDKAKVNTDPLSDLGPVGTGKVQV